MARSTFICTAAGRGSGADLALGREICRRDDSVDALNDSVFRILLTHMMEDTHVIGTAIELLLVSRNLERVADLATNIAEDVIFWVQGSDVRHHMSMSDGTTG